MVSIGVLGTGAYVPERVVTNEDIASLVTDATPEWIVRRTGILARRWAAPDQATSDLAARAATRALDAAGCDADRVDYLIVSTSTGDHPQPPTSCLVQHLIAAPGAACFDLNVVCAGFVYGVELARALVTANRGTRALVIGADLYSRILDFTDRRTSVLLGDGAGAVLIGEVAEEHGIMATGLSSYGHASDLIKVVAGGSRFPVSERTVADGQHFFTMDGRGVRDFVMRGLPELLEKLVAGAGLDPADVDCFVPHQANGVLLRELVMKCSLQDAYTSVVVDRYGNLGSASVPVALDDAVRSGHLATGDLVLLSGFGGGMSVANCLVRWSA
ncbi:3-oxoacyl-[acyl-carrier-protein] synthase 3 [Streptomyces hygroscopicus subsp. sporocinereus]|uniref:3-oxoacyl-[acyl-carrier-protein] synthase 3 n=1 Tax=Streptomyces hygroscopicus TaxID=1912 RepID=A0ABQ3TQL5_STRHY|nr:MULTISPECIES: ketoacyl-ACP synthase III [unclassified Streptomyces]MCO8306280.1 ketoacyl-ACP synthase III [Streptomyces sp. RKCA744]MDN3056462.1 ketoacyl-ACP synthase III [Streptomyces sp. SRF1]GHJ25624.1 3-oxoacyl-[acyl-carrier-protein] synthase 3 [Streptomyces hygroscopicus]